MTTLQAEYKQQRERQREHLREGHTYSHRIGFAATALRIARDEIALQQAEQADRIRFDWEYDDEYNSDDSWGLDDPAEQAEVVAAEQAKLNSGEWVAERCIAYVPAVTCPHCGGMIDAGPETWRIAASLHGIVHESGDEYTREVERELAGEAGII